MSQESVKPLLLGLNFPFCPHKCSYCSQQSQIHTEVALRAYGQAMLVEMAAAAEEGEGRTVTAVSLEGGCPGLMSADSLQEILRGLRKHFPLAGDVQIGIQTMPGEYSQAFMRKLRDNGVNFWTIGLQTAVLEEHLLLDRPYKFDALTMVDAALKAFEPRSLNFELLYGIPGQSSLSLGRSLEKVLAYEPDHITLAPLRLLHGTRLYDRCRAGAVTPMEPRMAADLYEEAAERLESLGYRQYTTSGFARPGGQDRFRLGLLRGEDLLGLGYQAKSCLDGLCYSTGHNFNEYLSHSGELEIVADQVAQLSEEGQALRLAVGRLERLEAVEGSTLGNHLSPLLESGALENAGTGYRLTPLGIASGALYRIG